MDFPGAHHSDMTRSFDMTQKMYCRITDDFLVGIPITGTFKLSDNHPKFSYHHAPRSDSFVQSGSVQLPGIPFPNLSALRYSMPERALTGTPTGPTSHFSP